MKTFKQEGDATNNWNIEGLSKKEDLVKVIDDVFAGDRLLSATNIDESIAVTNGSTLASEHINTIQFERSRELRLSSPDEQIMAVLLLTASDIDYGNINPLQRISATAQLLRAAQHGIFRRNGGNATTIRDKSEADTAKLIRKSFKYAENWMDEATKSLVEDAISEADLQYTSYRRALILKDKAFALIARY